MNGRLLALLAVLTGAGALAWWYFANRSSGNAGDAVQRTVQSIGEDLTTIGSALGFMTRGIRNNNPGNLEASGIVWNGMTGQDSGGYLIFASPQMGARALGHDLRTAIGEGFNTISTLMPHYAPASENNVPAYVADVEARTGIDAAQRLQASDSQAIAAAIAVHENGAAPWTAPDGTVYSETDVMNWAGLA